MLFPSFNTIDLAILVIIGLSILMGVIRGATREVLGIAGWVGAFATVFYGLPLFRPLGRTYIKNPMVADAIIAGLLFILSLAVFILISRLISAGVKGSILNSLDRSLGLVFGFIRGVLVICLAYLCMGFFYPPNEVPDIVKMARFLPWVSQGASELKRLIPEDYLPKKFSSSPSIIPLDAQDLLEHSLPDLEETVKNLSTLKPTSPKKAAPHYNDAEKKDLDRLFESGNS